MRHGRGIQSCFHCHGPLIEIDHYGERLVGCIEVQSLELARE
jgi:hypothetical protein